MTDPSSHGFDFQTVKDIRFGAGRLAALPNIVKGLGAGKSVLVVTDPGVRAAGLVDGSLAALRGAGFDVSVFDDIVADPPEATIEAAAEAARGVEAVIGFGGGSSCDAAKLAAVVSQDEQPLADMYGVNQVRSSRKPLVLIPTTAGTGTEVTPISIVTTGETTKSGVVSPALFADVALLDPALTVGLPAHVTAATGIDAMVHAIEAYTSVHKKNPISDALAREALSLLYAHVPGACTDGTNMEHRSGALLGAMLAGQAFTNAPVAAVHALAYPLGGIYHLPHGLTNALMLPHVLRFNLADAAPAYAELAKVIDPNITGSIDARADAFIAAMSDLSEQLGLPHKLRDVGVSNNRLHELAEDAMKQTRLLQNNPREMTLEHAREIYEQAW